MKPLYRDRNFRFLAISSLFVLFLTPLLARGRAGGDQSEVILEVSNYWDSGLGLMAWFSKIAENPTPHAVLYHHFGWFVVENSYYSLIKMVFAVCGFSNQALFEAFLALPETALVLTGMCLAVKYLIERESMSTGTAILVTAGTFGGSTLVFQLHGGTVECIMIFLMMVRLWASAPAGEALGIRRAIGLAVVDSLLIALKAYSVIFIIPLFLASPWLKPGGRKSWIVYVVVLTGLAIGWLMVKAQIPVDSHGYYKALLDIPPTPAEAATRLGELLLSPYTGIVWAAPLSFLALAAGRQRLPVAFAKMVGILGILTMLCFFWFWFDGEGHRYWAPFVVSLLPEVGLGAARLAKNWRAVWLAFPIAVALFLPAADYWPRWLPVYFVTDDHMPPRPVEIDSSGMLDINDAELAPPLFAWRVVLAELQGIDSLNMHPFDREVVLPLRAVFPFTGISRLIFVLSRHQRDFPEALSALHSLHADSALLWRFVRWGALVSLGFVLSWATRRSMIDDGTNGHLGHDEVD